ncbi:alpha/beta fold hydrolase [Candidatus Solincola sp.]|jgi:pimeloyl-ACP methyl ester carboxylesterase|nr:alpha/beta fold hydrolase [Actinomycetota bacterium]MDI7252573.1 alpha/beta fold hydrolase [Actinomycetota bacterium]
MSEASIYRENTVEANGIRIYYREMGSGDPLLLIMGLGGNVDWWTPKFLKSLASRYHVVAFDNRGAGRSEKPPGPYSIPQMADDAAALMDRLGWSSAHVLGMSMGGMIAQELALQHPERVRKLVLLVTTCGGPEQVPASPEVLQVLYSPKEGISPEVIARSTLYLLYPRKYIEENPGKMEEVVKAMLLAPIPPAAFALQLAAIINWSSHSRLKDIHNPTLIITGSEDILIPPENSRILARAIPNSRLVEYPGGGHGLIGQFPVEVAGEIAAFLG